MPECQASRGMAPRVQIPSVCRVASTVIRTLLESEVVALNRGYATRSCHQIASDASSCLDFGCGAQLNPGRTSGLGKAVMIRRPIPLSARFPAPRIASDDGKLWSSEPPVALATSIGDVADEPNIQRRKTLIIVVYSRHRCPGSARLSSRPDRRKPSRDGLASPFGRADQRCRSCGTANEAMSFYYRRRLTCAYVRGRAATPIQNSPQQHGIMPCRPRRCGVT